MRYWELRNGHTLDYVDMPCPSGREGSNDGRFAVMGLRRDERPLSYGHVGASDTDRILRDNPTHPMHSAPIQGICLGTEHPRRVPGSLTMKYPHHLLVCIVHTQESR